MFQNIPRSPSHQNTTFIQNSIQQTSQTQSIKITPIISVNKSTPNRDRNRIFTSTPNHIQTVINNSQRLSATSISIPQSSFNNDRQVTQISGNFFMSPYNSEKRQDKQDKPIQNSQLPNQMNYQQITTNLMMKNQTVPQTHAIISKTLPTEYFSQTNINLQGQNSSPLIQSVVFQPTTNTTNNYTDDNNINRLIDDNQDMYLTYPFKPTQESQFQVIENFKDGAPNVQSKLQQANREDEEEQCRIIVKTILAENKKSFEENIILSAEGLKAETAANQKQLVEIKESIASSKNDVVNKLNEIYHERYENIQQEYTQLKLDLQEMRGSIKKRVEEEYLLQFAKSMSDQISKLVQKQWEEAEYGVQKQVQGLQTLLEGFDSKQGQAFIEVGEYLSRLKNDIEKVFFEGQAYFKTNLDAFGQNLSEKINTADVKSVFVQMNEGFYDGISTKLDSLKARTDSVTGSLKQMQDDQQNKLEQMEKELVGYFSSLQSGVEKLEKSQETVDEVVVGFQNACSTMSQYKNKVDVLESIIRNLVVNQKNNQISADNQLNTKVDLLVEALSKMQENFLKLKQKYENESTEWKKHLNQNVTLNDSKMSAVAATNLSTQSIASFNSQLIQVTNQNKQLMESMRFKEQMIQEQKMLIQSFEKKIATQSNQLSTLIKELKQIKQESKQRQNAIPEGNSSMFSSIQSIKSSANNNQSISDSLQNDFINNVQILSHPNSTKQSNINIQQVPCGFNELEDYQEDQDEDVYFDEDQCCEQNKLNTDGHELQHNEKEIQEYFRKMRTEESQNTQIPRPLSTYEQDFFFYPYQQEQQVALLTQTSEINIKDLRSLQTHPSQNINQQQDRQQQQQQQQLTKSNLFTKKVDNQKPCLRPKRTIPKKGTMNSQPNIENHQPTYKSPLANNTLPKHPFSHKDLPLKVITAEINSSAINTISQLSSPSNNIQQNQINCFSQPLKNKNVSQNVEQQPTLSTQSDQSQSMNSQTNINSTNTQTNNSACNTNNELPHLIKRRLLYNNTLKEKKEQKLKVKLEENNRLKDEFGKFIYDKNGQALQFTIEQLENLHRELQIIELI